MKIILVFFAICCFSSLVFAQSNSEDWVFDQQVQQPKNLLKDLYDDSELLVLANGNHDLFSVFEHLKILLNQVGNDPRLTKIIIERSDDVDSFFRDLSVNPLTNVLDHGHFGSEFSKSYTMCQSNEWSYTIADFLPEIQRINHHRASKKLIVSSIDSVPSYRDFIWPGNTEAVTMEECKLNPFLPWFIVSKNREDETANIFIQKILNQRVEGEKIIIVYHHAHILENFESCFPSMNAHNEWKTELTELSWFGRVLDKFPNLRKKTKIVMFDEVSEYNPSGVTKFIQRQSKRFGDRDFGINLKHFSNVSLKTGMDAFAEDSFLAGYHSGHHKSTARLDMMADGVVWTSRAEDRYALQGSHFYLPNHCNETPKKTFPMLIP